MVEISADSVTEKYLKEHWMWVSCEWSNVIITSYWESTVKIQLFFSFTSLAKLNWSVLLYDQLRQLSKKITSQTPTITWKKNVPSQSTLDHSLMRLSS